MTTSVWRFRRPKHAGLLAGAIANGMEIMERDQGAILPDLRATNALGLACDFSGQHAQSHFDTYAFLLFDASAYIDWEAARATIRKVLIRDDRRISYKNLRDNVQWRALEPFLAAAGTLPGIILTVSADKRFSPEFIVGPGFRMQEFEDISRFNDWKVSTVLKAAWVVHTAAILIAGLAAAGQNLLWVMDQDEIVETAERRKTLIASFIDVISDYLNFDMGGVEMITADQDPGTRRVEDLLSIADLTAGAWADTFTTIRSARDAESLKEIFARKSERARDKAQLICEWSAQNTRRRLKYMNIAMSPGDERMPVYSMYIHPRRSA